MRMLEQAKSSRRNDPSFTTDEEREVVLAYFTGEIDAKQLCELWNVGNAAAVYRAARKFRRAILERHATVVKSKGS